MPSAEPRRSRWRAPGPRGRASTTAPGDGAWHRPPVLGYVASTQVAAGTAAPFLAGTTATMISILIPYADQAHRTYVRWLPPTLACLLLAAGALLATIQCGTMVRRYDVQPSQLLEFEPLGNTDGLTRQRLMDEQEDYLSHQLRWSARTRWAYHAGVLLLLASLVLITVPTHVFGAGDLIPATAALAMLAAEGIWVAAVTVTPWEAIHRAFCPKRQE
jgi:hypothetical protein